jgi:hypothetical protein
MILRTITRRGLFMALKPLLLARAWAPLCATVGAGSTATRRYYRADAVITLFSMPIFSKSGVGSGFAFEEEVEQSGARARRLGFGAGSWPDRAHGLNRLGYIHENLVETNGQLTESRYFGFMTTSQEERLEEARAAMKNDQQSALFSAIQGVSERGSFSARFTRFISKDAVSWRKWRRIADEAEKSFAGDCVSDRAEHGKPRNPDATLPTLLYALNRAREAGLRSTKTVFIYGGVQRELTTESAADPKMGEHMRERGLIGNAKSVMHLSGMTRNLQTGIKTHFSVWWDKDSASALPLRIEMEARSFLRLAFEVDHQIQVQEEANG